MKKHIKTSRWMTGLIAAGCVTGMGAVPRADAEVSQADFDSLKNLVLKLSDQVQSLRQTNQLVQQLHEQDLQQIQQLQTKLAETSRTATDAQQKAVAASQTSPLPRVPIDEATVNHNFQILGDAEVQFAKTSGQNASFVMADFAPIFLYRGGDKVLFESGFDFILQNNPQDSNPSTPGNTTTLNLSFAQLDYVVNDYLTLCAGSLLLPLGTYSERSAGWLNKFPDSPLARDFVPGTGVGAELRGALPLGDYGTLLNYSVYGVNGPGSSASTGNTNGLAGSAGSLDLGGNVGWTSDGAYGNLHSDPSGGGRVAVFVPFKPHYDLELGLSAQSGVWDNAGQHLWTAGVADVTLHLGPNLEAKGEYIMSQFGSDDLGKVTQQGWWAQVGYKLAGLNLELPGINNLELVGRYDSVRDGAVPGTSTQRTSIGGVYYISNALLFEGAYEFSHSSSLADLFILQLSYGF